MATKKHSFSGYTTKVGNKGKKITIGLILIFIFLYLGKVSLNYLETEKVRRNETDIKNELFKKNEYCRLNYLPLIEKDLERRWGKPNPYFSNISQIFYSPTMNECLYEYELNYLSGTVSSSEKIVARAATGDFVLHVNKNESQNMTSYIRELGELIK